MRNRLRVRMAAASLACLVIGGGAGAGGPPASGSGLESVPCWFDVPAGHDAACFRFAVPEDRSRPEGWTLRLPVAILKTPGGEHHEDPVLYLAGGPGFGAWLERERIDFWWNSIDDSPWLRSRDLILFDQRGAGMADPQLACPELRALAVPLLQLGTDEAAGRGMIRSAARACRARLVGEGHNLAAYTSAASAEDVAALRTALGVAQWNLYGVSYGTRLALTVMRDHPDGVRSVILDSVYPPEARAYEEGPAAAARAFGRVFANCAASAECDGQYPDLERVLLSTVDFLNRHPRRVIRPDPRTGREVEVRLTGDLLVEWAFYALYLRDEIPALPRRFQEVIDGRDSAFGSIAAELLEIYQDVEDLGEAMGLSVECSEEFPFNDPARIESEIRRLPAYRTIVANDTTTIACAEWQVPAAPDIEDEPVRSDIPALLLAGEYDPVTPPAWARLAASRLPNAYLFEFAGTTHDVLGTNACAGVLAAAFLDRPSLMPTAPCLGESSEPTFAPPAVSAGERRDVRKSSKSE